MPPVTPSKTAWITLEAYKAFLDPGSTDTTQNNIRQLLINGACDQIEKELHRPVVQRQLTAMLDGGQAGPGLAPMRSGPERLFLRAPIIVPKVSPGSAITVTEAVGQGDPVTLTLGVDYYVYDDEGHIRRYRGGRTAYWAPGIQNINVTYTTGLCTQVWEGGGYNVGTFTGVLPTATRTQEYDVSTLVLAALELTKFHEKSGPLSMGSQITEGVFIRPDKIPSQVLRLLAPWRLANIG
jgi:hypothetical protein